MFHHIKKEREREEYLFPCLWYTQVLYIHMSIIYILLRASIRTNAPKLLTVHCVSCDAFAIVARDCRQNATGSSAFRVLSNFRCRSSRQIARCISARESRGGEKSQNQLHSPSIREIETRGIRRNRKYIERPMYYYVSVRYNARNKCLADVKTILKIIKIKRDS